MYQCGASTDVSLVHVMTLHCACIVYFALYIECVKWLSRVQCVQKKRDQNVFCNIFYKTRAILMKFGV